MLAQSFATFVYLDAKLHPCSIKDVVSTELAYYFPHMKVVRGPLKWLFQLEDIKLSGLRLEIELWPICKEGLSVPTKTQAKKFEHRHLVRYGISGDQDFLLGDYTNTYSAVLINASMFSHATAAIAKFLSEKNARKPFLIDPQTHAFQGEYKLLCSNPKDPDLKLKRSISKLADIYGDPITACTAGARSLTIRDFANIDRDNFVKKVLAYQCDSVQNQVSNTDANEYYEFLANHNSQGDNSLRPYAVFSPYFYIDTVKPPEAKGWLQIICDLAIIAISMLPQERIVVQLVFDRSSIYNFNSIQKYIESVIQSLHNSPPAAFGLWIDDFNEHEASYTELVSYAKVIGILGKIAPVFLPFGSYWSIANMISNSVSALKGVGHSLGYGESRQVYPVGGGIPVPNFYMPRLHRRLKFGSALAAVEQMGGFKSKRDYLRFICSCSRCQKVIRSSSVRESFINSYGQTQAVSFKRGGYDVTVEYPSKDSQENSISHYMLCKSLEYSGQISLDTAIKEATDISNQLKNTVGPDGIRHCSEWINAWNSAQSIL